MGWQWNWASNISSYAQHWPYKLLPKPLNRTEWGMAERYLEWPSAWIIISWSQKFTEYFQCFNACQTVTVWRRFRSAPSLKCELSLEVFEWYLISGISLWVKVRVLCAIDLKIVFLVFRKDGPPGESLQMTGDIATQHPQHPLTTQHGDASCLPLFCVFSSWWGIHIDILCFSSSFHWFFFLVLSALEPFSVSS